MTSNGVACPPFVLFSTGVGDAWLLEPDEHLAMCLVWHGERQAIGLRDDPDRIEVEWDCAYDLLGDFFSVESQHPVIGRRAIGGYPLDDVRKLLDRAQSTMIKMASVIGQFDAVEITPEVIAQMVKKGWSEEEVLGVKAEGYRYSPGRDSLLGPVMSSEDNDTEYLRLAWRATVKGAPRQGRGNVIGTAAAHCAAIDPTRSATVKKSAPQCRHSMQARSKPTQLKA